MKDNMVKSYFIFIFKPTASNVVSQEQDTMNVDVDVVVLVENLSIVVESGKISLPWVELKKKDTFLLSEQYQLNNLTKPGMKEIIQLKIIILSIKMTVNQSMVVRDAEFLSNFLKRNPFILCSISTFCHYSFNFFY